MSLLLVLALCCTSGKKPNLDEAQLENIAFPTAIGYAKNTVGGRAGRVIKVTNLDDSGPGSLREALQSHGKRTVVFTTGGIINLQSPIFITEPYVTVAGQTSPGGGITINGAGIYISTSQVIIRYLRIRPGYSESDYQGDCITIIPRDSNISNIIIDHCSLTWAYDECIGFNDGGFSIYNVSVTNCIIAEALKAGGGPDFAKGVLLNKASNYAQGSYIYNTTFYANLFAHNENRNVMCSEHNEMEFTNNLIYNFVRGTIVKSHSKVSIIGNFYKPGSNTIDHHGVQPGVEGVRNRGIQVIDPDLPSTAAYYLRDNIGLGRSREFSGNENEWMEVWSFNDSSTDGSQYQVSAPPRALSGVSALSATDVPQHVLKNVGANLPKLDLIDRRIIKDVFQSSGNSIVTEEEVGGYVPVASGKEILDSDNDGMADSWEMRNSLDPDSLDSHLYSNGDSYTNLERYFMSLERVD